VRYVSSFGPAGYELYGKRFLETFTEHHSAPITVYVEDDAQYLTHPQITYRQLFDVPGCKEFLGALAFPAFRGQLWGGKRNYRFDVYTFCRKSFAQCDAATEGGKWMAWIDADIEFSGTLPEPSGNSFMHYLGRPQWHSCASYVAWNLKHPMAGEFFKRYWAVYVTGTVFALPEWHDSFVLDVLRENMKVPAVNLAEEIEGLDGPANVFDAVFPMGHHKKGNLKRADK